MARLNCHNRTDKQLPQTPVPTEAKPVAFRISAPAPHRQLSLLTITIVLNTLLWSSVLCSIIALFQIASDSEDGSNILPGVLTLVSATVTIVYTIVHTTYSVKQRALTYQQLDPSTIKKTTYIANRLVVSLCVLWLLTAGWNMILVARRPRCLPNQLDGQSWESGITCLISRVGMALAMISLVASLTLFGMMAAVRRPFEAHLFAYGQRQPASFDPTPPPSRRPSEDRAAIEKLVPESGMPAYDHARSTSMFTNADVETLDLNVSRSASIIRSSSPTIRDRADLGVFISPFAPPPLPPAFMISPSLQSQTPVSNSFAHRRCISLTPRTDALLAPAAYVPYSIPIEFSASAQRAVYPDVASPYRSISMCRSQPQLRSMSSFSYRHHYSRSSVSLSRPHRLSSLAPVPHLECSSRSETLKSSEGISETGESPNGKSVASSIEKRASAAEIVHAIANNTPFPGTNRSSLRKHWRTVSAPDAAAGVRQAHSGARMAMGWKPDLAKSQTVVCKPPPPLSFHKLVRSASAELLGCFGTLPDRAALDAERQWKRDFEVEVETRLNAMHVLPFSDGRKSQSPSGSETETLRESYDAGSLEDATRFEDAKEIFSVRPVSRDIAFL